MSRMRSYRRKTRAGTESHIVPNRKEKKGDGIAHRQSQASLSKLSERRKTGDGIVHRQSRASLSKLAKWPSCRGVSCACSELVLLRSSCLPGISVSRRRCGDVAHPRFERLRKTGIGKRRRAVQALDTCLKPPHRQCPALLLAAAAECAELPGASHPGRTALERSGLHHACGQGQCSW